MPTEPLIPLSLQIGGELLPPPWSQPTRSVNVSLAAVRPIERKSVTAIKLLLIVVLVIP